MGQSILYRYVHWPWWNSQGERLRFKFRTRRHLRAIALVASNRSQPHPRCWSPADTDGYAAALQPRQSAVRLDRRWQRPQADYPESLRNCPSAHRGRWPCVCARLCERRRSNLDPSYSNCGDSHIYPFAVRRGEYLLVQHYRDVSVTADPGRPGPNG